MAPLAYVIQLNGFTEKVVAVAAVCTAVIAIGGFLRHVNRVLKGFNALADLANYELNSNGGGSLKDHAREAVQNSRNAEENSEKALAIVTNLAAEFRLYRNEQQQEQVNMWRAIALNSLDDVPDYNVQDEQTVERHRNVRTQESGPTTPAVD